MKQIKVIEDRLQSQGHYAARRQQAKKKDSVYISGWCNVDEDLHEKYEVLWLLVEIFPYSHDLDGGEPR